MTTASADFTLPVDAMAKLLDLTPRRLQQLAQQGHIPKPLKGKYELVGTVQGYVKYLKGLTAGAAIGGELFSNARARRTDAAADIQEMERDKMRGSLLHREEVMMAWTAIAQTVKARLLLIPAKIAPRLLQQKTAVAAQQLVKDEITQALSHLSTYTVPALPSAGSRDGGGGVSGVRPTARANNKPVG